MLLTLRTTNTHGNARSTADAVISALTPAAWYRNATGVTSAGGFASKWDDYSGNARHLVQATGTNQPAYAAGVFTFDGADNYMKTGAFTLDQPCTIIAAVLQAAWAFNEVLLDGNTAGEGSWTQSGASPNLLIQNNIAGISTNPDLAIGAWGILAATYNGASSVIQLNDNAAVTGTMGALAIGGLILGAEAPGTAWGWAACSFKEVVAFPSALSDSERGSVITALNNALTVF